MMSCSTAGVDVHVYCTDERVRPSVEASNVHVYFITPLDVATRVSYALNQAGLEVDGLDRA